MDWRPSSVCRRGMSAPFSASSRARRVPRSFATCRPPRPRCESARAGRHGRSLLEQMHVKQLSRAAYIPARNVLTDRPSGSSWQ